MEKGNKIIAGFIIVIVVIGILVFFKISSDNTIEINTDMTWEEFQEQLLEDIPEKPSDFDETMIKHTVIY